jgi:hypothetical protein
MSYSFTGGIGSPLVITNESHDQRLKVWITRPVDKTLFFTELAALAGQEQSGVDVAKEFHAVCHAYFEAEINEF